ncbi:MAG: MBL fold metallo-hydrolase [Halobacteriota archaeon]
MIHNVAAGVQAFTSNAFLVTGEQTALVDTGANFDVVSRIRDHVDEVDVVVITHTHPDHVGNVDAVREAFDVETWGYDTDQPAVDNELGDEQSIQLGDHFYTAYHTPGHKNDHLCLYAGDSKVLFAGDLVFQNGAFGRTDLEEGDRERLVESIDRLLTVVDDELREMHVGHGPSVTENPYGHVELASRTARTW